MGFGLAKVLLGLVEGFARHLVEECWVYEIGKRAGSRLT
jgi:hypothetical protein